MIWFRSYLNGLVVFPPSLISSLYLEIRSSWSEPQSSPFFLFICLFVCFCWLCRTSLYLWLQRIWFQNWPSSDVHVCSHLLCFCKRVLTMTSGFSWQNCVSLCPASCCTPRPNLPVIPGISWPPTFAFQSPIMKRISFFFFFGWY